jgi:glycosyltransferase involved in cell wall biosynthesis
MPGQCVETFKVAKSLGIKTVLNHPTGPVGMQLDALREEYKRAGLASPDHSEHARYLLSLEQQEYALADYHCVASSVVKEQLCRKGVVEEKIWVIPYGADPEIWNRGAQDSLFSTEGSCQKEGSQTKAQGECGGADQNRTPSAQRTFRIVFAGQLSLRKGLRFLLEALEHAGSRNWILNVYGRVVDESKADRDAYSGAIPVNYHGAVGQHELAEAFRAADILVLPSLEDGFGLVVPQALSCGIPCVVSDRVGAKDLIQEGINGSVFTCGDSKQLADQLLWWSNNRIRLNESFNWRKPAEVLMQYCENN